MTTRLAGPATRFLPFNKGDDGAAGNPPSRSGHRTSYLWEEVWERESFLDILGRYMVTEKDDKKKADALSSSRDITSWTRHESWCARWKRRAPGASI